MSVRPTLGELIVIESSNGRELDGILYRSTENKQTIVHVHGSFGNFYQGPLVKAMARTYADAGINFLSLNMSCHDGLAESSFRDQRFEYCGGSVSEFNECVDDISGAITFAQAFSEKVVLQGHSLGCDRVLHYLIETGARHDLIMLSPCDSYQLQANWIAPETVEAQIERLKRYDATEHELEWLPSHEYGIAGNKEWTYKIPITRRAFLSIAAGPPYRLIRPTNPSPFRLEQRALVCVGGQDALQVWPAEVMVAYFRSRLNEVEEHVISEADHMFSGFEESVATRIASWTLTHG